MTNRVFIIHGWEGYPEEGWLPWLKRELEARGFQVMVPTMPETKAPKIEKWVPHLVKLVDEADENTYLVGHSMGCQTIARYLESLPERKKVGGAAFVAGFIQLIGLTPEEEVIWKQWLEAPIDWEKVKRSANRFVAIHSDNDPFVPLENAEFFKEKLGAEIIVEHEKGHFSESDGITELPSALEAILKMAQ